MCVNYLFIGPLLLDLDSRVDGNLQVSIKHALQLIISHVQLFQHTFILSMECSYLMQFIKQLTKLVLSSKR